MGVPSAQRQADLLKDKGNLYFKKEKLRAAIEMYTEAITLCPNVPLYWTNRAVCERKREEWEKVEGDCRKALELDNRSVKAHYLLGLALVHYQQYEEAVKQLEKAMDLGRGVEGKGNYLVEEIWQELAKARFAEWEAVSDVRQRQQLDLKVHLSHLLREDYERQLNEALACIKAAAAACTDYSPNVPAACVIDGPFPIEVDDLNRFNSGSKNSDLQEGPTGGFNFEDAYPEFSRLYRAQSEPPSVIQMSQGAETGAAFDPLKQHKLFLRRTSSSSIQRQRSNQFSLADRLDKPASPAPVRSERNSEGNEKESETASSPAPVRRRTEESQPAAPVPEIKSDAPMRDIQREDPPPPTTAQEQQPPASAAVEFHSIYDVFKVFKEFMKLRQDEAGQKLLRLSELYQRRSKVLEDVFEKAAVPDNQVEIPDHLCCKITMDIFKDPVISTSGITYERAAILDHLRKVGSFDPVTRAPLLATQLVSNIGIRDAVQAYLDEHGWAYGPL